MSEDAEIRITLVMFLFALVAIFGSAEGCPDRCACSGRSVVCTDEGLVMVPRGIPANTEKLDLRRNNISHISRSDFAGLPRLRRLFLNANQITWIDHHAFDDLTQLHTLQLDNNELTCISPRTFFVLASLEVLTLNNNNLTSLAADVFGDEIPSMRTFRLHSNPLHCDCHLRWLANWVRSNPTMAVFAQCHLPVFLRGRSLADPKNDFVCENFSPRRICEVTACPAHCQCNGGVVDCRNSALTVLPTIFPDDSTELRLEQNLIARIPTLAFLRYTNLRRIDLSNNLIEEIESGAFSGLESLTSLVLYRNKLTTLPGNVFMGLPNLQMLLLNANNLRCLRQDTFDGLTSLNLLSLYDNKLQYLTKGTFDSLRAIETLHLAQNPFICDCRLGWLSKYLKKNPVETSGAKCAGPARNANKRIAQVKKRKFRCRPGQRAELEQNTICAPEIECPTGCHCDSTTVDCSGQGLTSLPDNIPPHVSNLIFNRNNIGRLANNGAFRKLSNLRRIDLSFNRITEIEDGALAGASSLAELFLSNNLLETITASALSGLPNLRTLTIRSNQLSCIGNHTFGGLSSLRHLSLYGNRITTIVNGAFSTLTSLTTLNMLANPLHCDCHLGWFSTWLRERNVASGNPRCSSAPSRLLGIPISDINSQDFRCDSKQALEAPTCAPVQKCPSGCDCQGPMLRCANVGLSVIPVSDISDDVQELYLERNEIAVIPEEINRYKDLTTIDLSNNHIRSVTDYLFRNLTRLTRLVLAYNRIQCIPVNTFSGLTSLRSLSLHSNDLSSLPEGVFNGLEHLSHVGFGLNPWYCDCNLRWFAQYFDQMGLARCSGPTRMEGRLLTSVPRSSFVCRGPLDIAIAAKCNPCLSSPCRHNSSCKRHVTDSYQCQCQPGFKGRHCEMPISPCVLAPCLNGGTCHAKDEIRYMCRCRQGFQGTRCELDVDDCVGRPCPVANATCIDQINSFTCKCPSGWQGEHCNVQIRNQCDVLNPCQNGGRCVEMQLIDSSSYRCECPSGFAGVNCSTAQQPCENHKCENGVCKVNFNLPIKYQCNCYVGYRGEYCSTPTMDVLIQDDPCSNHDCQNGGKCYTRPGQAGYECWCMGGFAGERCEKLHGISMQKNGSYVQTNTGSGHNINITIVLSTSKLFGVLFYKGSSESREHLAIEFYSGHVRVSVDLGSFPGSTLYSTVPINDGKTHTVQLVIKGQIISLTIDGAKEVRASAGEHLSQSYRSLNSSYVGGIRLSTLLSARRMLHIRNSTSFIGCIHGLYINTTQVDFMELVSSQSSIRPGCVQENGLQSCARKHCSEQGNCSFFNHSSGLTCKCDHGFGGDRCQTKMADNCDNHDCQHGTCVPEGKSYKCQCATGYGGRLCDRPDCSNVNCKRGTCQITKAGYKCKCKKNYSGRLCDKRVRSCRGSLVRQFFNATRTKKSIGGADVTMTCRSKRQYKNMVCGSRCPAPRGSRGHYGAAAGAFGGVEPRCCRPLRFRVKRIRMRCDDGSRISQVVQKVRRCACQACT